MEPLPTNHRCAAHDEVDRLRALCEQLRAEVARLKEQLANAKRRTHGHRSERLKLVVKDGEQKRPRRPRKRRKETRPDVPKETVQRRVPPEERVCPKCGKNGFRHTRDVTNTTYETIPARVVQRTTVDEVLECTSCSHEISSEKPVKVVEGGDYGASFIAEVVVAKVADCIPHCRQAKRYTRNGLPMARSTLTDLFHVAAKTLRPLWQRLLAQVALSSLVQADETTMRVQALQKCRTAWMWVFLTSEVIAYQFSAGRSGATPRKVLGPAGNDKTVVVDGYTGYNKVEKLDGWRRAGCKAHGRRKFFDAHPHAPAEAEEALIFFRDMYRVEHEAERAGIKGTAAHLDLRRRKALPVYRQFHRWLIRMKPKYPPTSTLGGAIRYALNQRNAWMRCFRDARIPIDNNASEAALRVVALLRKNALFVGDDESGENHAILLSLVATCQMHGVNPQAYLEDVLLRVQTHPASRIDELLPQNWKRLFGVAAPASAAA